MVLGPRKTQIHRDTNAWSCQSGTLGIQLQCTEPFSWTRFLVSVFSYVLLLSDVVRSGLGIANLSGYFAVQPDVYLAFDPAGYNVVHLTLANATDGKHKPFWTYKYDTTSLGMRSVVEHLRIAEWPLCVLYKERCEETQGLPMSTLFSMLDSLVHATASEKEHQSLTLRTANEFKDRVHHYALPWFFDHSIKRTTQAIYYPRPTEVLCGHRVPRPFVCRALWTKYAKGLCGRKGYPPCDRKIWSDIPRRQAQLLRAYPNHTLDFVIIETANDVAAGGLTFQGHQDCDIVIVTRVRNCTAQLVGEAPSCETLAVDDYRYETAYFNMDAPGWFVIVASLRIFGQTYMWIRVIFLFWGCYLVSSYTPQQRQLSRFRRLSNATKKFFLIPSQVVVYGSITPILAHASAHLINSPATYELITSHFNSLLGDFKLNPTDFLHHCSVSMRTVWTLAIACHLAVALATARVWSPLHGTIGVPEFSISLIACATIFGQYKATSLRRTRVLQIHPVTSSHRQREQNLGQSYEMLRGPMQKFLAGSPLDVKCLTTACFLLVAIAALTRLLQRLFPTYMPFSMVLSSRSAVPATAGRFWTRNRLVVSWYSSIIVTEPKNKIHASPREAETTYSPGRVAVRGVSVRAMTRVDSRSRDVQSTVLLINLAAMTDPITLLRLRVLGGESVALYESKVTGHRVLLPRSLAMSTADLPIDWQELELIATTNTKNLSWEELLCCG